MKLINCPACGLQISPQAASCPTCGHPILAGRNREAFAVKLIVVLVLGGLLLYGIIRSVKQLVDNNAAADAAVKEITGPGH